MSPWPRAKAGGLSGSGTIHDEALGTCLILPTPFEVSMAASRATSAYVRACVCVRACVGGAAIDG